MVISRPLFPWELIPATNIIAAVIKKAEPNPTTNRKSTKGMYPGITAMQKLPIADSNAPRANTNRAPLFLVRIPAGILAKTRARAKALTANPTISAGNPLLSTSKGRMGPAIPCPIVMNIVDNPNRRI